MKFIILMLLQALNGLRVRLWLRFKKNSIEFPVGFELLLIQMSVSLCTCLLQSQDSY